MLNKTNVAPPRIRRGKKQKKQRRKKKKQQQQPELINKIFDDIRVFFFARYPFADKKESCDARRTQPASPKHSSSRGRTETRRKAETKKESNREEKATDEDGQRWTKMAKHRPDTGPRRTNIDEDGQRRTKTHGLRCRYWLPLRAATDILTYRFPLCTT